MNAETKTIDRRHVIPAASAEAMTLTAYLVAHAADGTIADGALSAAIGRDITGEGRGALTTALRRAMRDHGLVFERVRLIGYRCIVGAELVNAQKAGIDRIRREAKRRAEKISKVDAGKLDNHQRIEAATLQSMYGVVAHLATARSVARLETAVAKADAQLPIGQTFALFGAAEAQNGKPTAHA